MSGIIDALGFDAYTTPAKRFNSVVAGSTTISIGAYGRNSTDGLRIAMIFNTGGDGECSLTIPAKTTLYVGFGIKVSALPTGSVGTRHIFLILRDGGSNQIFFCLKADGTYEVRRGGRTTSTLLGTSSFAFLTGTYYHFSCKVVINDSTGIIETRINDITTNQITLSGVDTQETGNATINQIVLAGMSMTGNVSTANHDYDDLVIRDDDWPGDRRVREDLPTGTGAIDDGVPTGAADSRQAVDEADPDDDSTYTSLENIGEKFLLTYPTIPATAVVDAVITLPYASKSDAGAAKCKPEFRIGGNSYLGTEISPSNGSYQYWPEVHMVSPDSASPWTAAEVNAMEVGVQRTA